MGKKERLKSRKLIEALFKKGRNFNTFPFRVFYLLDENLLPHSKKESAERMSPIQFGTGASTRSFKKAVDRNRIKRLARENYRIQKQELIDMLLQKKMQMAVFLIYTGKDLPDYQMVNEKIAVVLQRLIKIVHESHSSGT